MRESKKPEIVHNTHEHPDWVDLPESRWVRSYLGAPIRNKGEVIGFLNLNSNTPNFFNSAHAQHLLAFADQAGTAIENSRLFNGLQKLRIGSRQTRYHSWGNPLLQRLH